MDDYLINVDVVGQFRDLMYVFGNVSGDQGRVDFLVNFVSFGLVVVEMYQGEFFGVYYVGVYFVYLYWMVIQFQVQGFDNSFFVRFSSIVFGIVFVVLFSGGGGDGDDGVFSNFECGQESFGDLFYVQYVGLVYCCLGIEVSFSDGFLIDGVISIVDEEIDFVVDSFDEVGDRFVVCYVVYYGLFIDFGGEWFDVFDLVGCIDDVLVIVCQSVGCGCVDF